MRTSWRIFKIGDIIDAIEKNGYPKAIGHYKLHDTYCAIGQAAKNLNVDVNQFGMAIAQRGPTGFYDTIVYLNDDTDMTIPEIAVKVRKKYINSLDTEISVLNYE